jgi:RNase P/RNase MRP subunit p30
LNFPNIDYRKRYFDSAEAELACSSAVALEIDLKPLLVIGGPTRARLLTTLRREVDIAREFRIPVLLSSGVNEQALMRKPRDLASLGYLFGMKEEQSLDSVSVNPSNIVTRNRQKLTDKYVAPGITIVKEGNS